MRALRVLLLGGTAQARELSLLLAKDARFDLVVSLKGLTEKPQAHGGRMISGGFGGQAGLHDYFLRNRIQACVNATHPFAGAMSRNAQEAARLAGIPVLRLKRQPWSRQDGDRWIVAAGVEQAVGFVAAGAKVFLALGAQGSGPFLERRDARFLIRTADPVPPARRWPNAEYVTGLPNQGAEAEAALMKAHGVSAVVARNSGGARGYAKIVAARRLGLPVVMIEPPPDCGCERVENCDSALKWLESEIKTCS